MRGESNREEKFLPQPSPRKWQEGASWSSGGALIHSHCKQRALREQQGWEGREDEAAAPGYSQRGSAGLGGGGRGWRMEEDEGGWRMKEDGGLEEENEGGRMKEEDGG